MEVSRRLSDVLKKTRETKMQGRVSRVQHLVSGKLTVYLATPPLAQPYCPK